MACHQKKGRPARHQFTAVDQQRQLGGAGDASRILQHILPRGHAQIRQSLGGIGHTRPRKIQREEARSLGQLRDAGKLQSLVGAAVGQLVDCESERYPETSACDVIRDVLVPEVDGPVVGGLAFGHVADNRALGVGVQAELDGDGATLTQLEHVVEDAG